MSQSYQDILYEVDGAAAYVTINRPEKYNAFRGQTCEELIDAIGRAGWDRSIAVVVLSGAGDKAFCTGGDQSAHEPARSCSRPNAQRASRSTPSSF